MQETIEKCDYCGYPFDGTEEYSPTVNEAYLWAKCPICKKKTLVKNPNYKKKIHEDKSSIYKEKTKMKKERNNKKMFDEEVYETNKVKLLVKIVAGVVLGIFLVITIFNSTYMLQEDQYAVLRTFGQVSVVETPGVKFKIPYIQKVRKVSKASKEFAVGYDLETEESVYKESFMITSDFNFANVDFYFEYQISDPVAYFYATEDPEIIVKNLAQSYIRDTVGSHTIDEVLTTGKYEIQSEIKEKLQERLDVENIGIQVTNAVIQDAEVPTTEVAQAFKNVEDAKQGMETAINNANADANTRIPAANAQADKIKKDAQAEKEALIAEAEGQVARFNSLYEEYIKFPLITKQRMFYETMEEILPNMNIYITDGSTQTMLPLEPFSEIKTN